MYPKYYKPQDCWLIALNDRGEVLYDDENKLVQFETQEEAEDFIENLQED